MIRLALIWWCLLVYLPLVAQDPVTVPTELAEALAVIGEGQSLARAPSGLIPHPVEPFYEFDVVDRCQDIATLEAAFAQTSEPVVRVLIAKAVRTHGSAAERLHMLQRCLFDGREFFAGGGCLVGRATVGDEVLASAWPDLSDAEHWTLLRWWNEQCDQGSNVWYCGARWPSFVDLLCTDEVLTLVGVWSHGSARERRRAARLLWLMTNHEQPHPSGWEAQQQVAFELLTRLASDQEAPVRSLALRGLTDAAVVRSLVDSAVMRERHLLTACDDPDDQIAVRSAMTLCRPPGHWSELAPSSTTLTLQSLLRRCTGPVLETASKHLVHLDQVSPRSDEHRILLVRLAERLAMAQDPLLIQTACRLAARQNDEALTALCLERVLSLANPPGLVGVVADNSLTSVQRQRVAEHLRKHQSQLAESTEMRLSLYLQFTPELISRAIFELYGENQHAAQEMYLALCELGEPRLLDALIARMDHVASYRRQRQLALYRFDDHAQTIHALRRHLANDDPLRTSAILTLALMEDHRSSTPNLPDLSDVPDLLRSVMNDPTNPRRGQAARAWRTFWPATSPQRQTIRQELLRLAEDPDPAIRREVLREAALIKDAAPLPVVLKALRDQDPDVRAAASRALPYDDGMVRDGFENQLHAGLTSADPLVRRACAVALCSRPGEHRYAGFAALVESHAWEKLNVVLWYAVNDPTVLALQRRLPPQVEATQPRWRQILLRIDPTQERMLRSLQDDARALRHQAWQQLAELMRPDLQSGFIGAAPNDGDAEVQAQAAAKTKLRAAAHTFHAAMLQRDADLGRRVLEQAP